MKPLFVLGVFITLVTSVEAQLTGTVVDGTGRALPFAVVVSRTGNGFLATRTDLDGRFAYPRVVPRAQAIDGIGLCFPPSQVCCPEMPPSGVPAEAGYVWLATRTPAVGFRSSRSTVPCSPCENRTYTLGPLATTQDQSAKHGCWLQGHVAMSVA